LDAELIAMIDGMAVVTILVLLLSSEPPFEFDDAFSETGDVSSQAAPGLG
jgi:hypothetical protein